MINSIVILLLNVIEEYNEMMTANCQLNQEEIDAKIWFCNNLQISNMAQLFPFGLENNYDLKNIMNSLKSALI